jgi:tetratricopeptide (TPR) repeat protein
MLLIGVLSGSHAQNVFMRVKNLMQEGNYKAADRLLDSCQKKRHFPDSTLYYRSMLQSREGKVKQSKRTWRELSEEYPGFGELHFLRGVIAFNETAYGRSIDEFTRAIEINPQHYKAIYNRALAYGMMDEYLFAIEDLGRLLAINPSDANIFYARAYWYEYTGNYTEAAKDYTECLKLDARNFDGYLGLAFSYRQLGEKEKACDAIERAIGAGSQIAGELKETYCD